MREEKEASGMQKAAAERSKRRKLRGEKGTTLYLRLFVFFACFTVSLVLVFLLILNLAGVFHIGTHKNQAWFENELEHLTQDISTDYGNLSVEGVNLAERVSKNIEACLKEKGILPADLTVHPEILEELLSRQVTELLSLLRNNKCGGAFLILDASVIDEAPAAHRSGLFLKRTEPNTVGAVGSRLHYLRGPAAVARTNGIELLGQWQMEFTKAETDFFTKTVETAREWGELSLSRLYYWTPRHQLAGNSEAGMLLSVPLIAGDGTVLGVCGFEVSAMLFKQSYSPDNVLYPRIFSVLAPIRGETLHMGAGLLAGNSYLNSALGSDTVTIRSGNAPLVLYRTGASEDYSGLHRAIPLYPADSPYGEETWAAAALAPQQELKAVAEEGMRGLRLGIAGLCLLSLLAAAVISHRYLAPLSKTLQRIRHGEGYATLPKTQYQEINDLLEFLTAQDEAASAALAEVESKALAQSVVIHPPVVDPERYQRFLRHLDTLTPAERRVFDLYVREYRAARIAKELHISENTVKYHNGNIYGKLEVGSRKELLNYIRAMRYEQQKQEKGE